MKYFLVILLLVASLSASTISWPPQFLGSVNMASQSHGSGYSPYANEFWVPLWGTSTVYRYDRNYNSLGTFTSGQSYMMQLWGDTDGSYYTANWNSYTITKTASMSNSTTLWSYSLSGSAGGVAADANYVYAMMDAGSSNGNIVYKLNKTTGALVGTIALNNMTSYLFGGLIVVDDYLIRGNTSGVIEYFSLTTGNKIGSYSTGYNIYGSAFDGTNYYIHQNDSTHEIYTLATSTPVPEPSSFLLMGIIAFSLFMLKNNSKS